MSRVALERKQISKEFILASGEKETNKFMVYVRFEVGSQVLVYILHHAAKGTQSSRWPEKQHPPGALLSRVRDGVVFPQW